MTLCTVDSLPHNARSWEQYSGTKKDISRILSFLLVTPEDEMESEKHDWSALPRALAQLSGLWLAHAEGELELYHYSGPTIMYLAPVSSVVGMQTLTVPSTGSDAVLFACESQAAFVYMCVRRKHFVVARGIDTSIDIFEDG